MPDIITLEAVYDNSDIMTDYFDRDHGIEEWYVCDLRGKVVTQNKLIRALCEVPDWLKPLGWAYRKGEKYSMSDHPYGQLRCDNDTGLTFRNSQGEMKKVRFIITASWREGFELNHKLNRTIPPTLEAMKAFIESKVKERDERLQKIKENVESSKEELKAKGKEVIPGVLYLI